MHDLKEMIETNEKHYEVFSNCFINRWILHESEIIAPLGIPNADKYQRPECPYKSLYEDDIRGLHEVHMTTPRWTQPNRAGPTPTWDEDDLDADGNPPMPKQDHEMDHRASRKDDL